jgi:hypothetical protein
MPGQTRRYGRVVAETTGLTGVEHYDRPDSLVTRKFLRGNGDPKRLWSVLTALDTAFEQQ